MRWGVFCSLAFLSVCPAKAAELRDFETYEYQRGGGLDLIHASSAYLLGYTGKNVIVAVMDTGIYPAHNKFNDKLLPGYDIYTEADVLVDPQDHGTHVAGIIAAHKTGRGMHGVAYDAKILPVLLLAKDDNDEETEKRFAAGFQYAFEHGARISNNSWGYATHTDKGYYGTSIKEYDKEGLEGVALDALREGVSRYDQIFVFSAGNLVNETTNQENPGMMAMLPQLFPELKQHWLAVVNVDAKGMINSSSHYCGEGAEWCIAAPGTNILSTIPGGYYERMTGTSMAAPHVSGGLAILAEAFPNLKGDQLVRRLLVTADKSGHFSDEAVYGQGLMDLKTATQPIGSLQLPADKNASGGLKNIPNWSQGAAFNLKAALGSKRLLVLDTFDRAPFQLEAQSLFASQQSWSHASLSTHPYFSDSSSAHIVGQYPIKQHSGWVWQAFQGEAGAHSTSQQGGLLGYRQAVGQGYLEYQSGTLIEHNQLLGFSGSVDNGYVPTVWQGLQIGWQWNSAWHLSTGWQIGKTKATPVDDALVSFDAPLWSQSWQVATQFEQAQHRWQLAWRQPVHVTSGKARLYWPDGIDADGTIHYQEEWVSLKQRPDNTIESIYQYQHTPRFSSQVTGSVTFQSAGFTHWAGLKMTYDLY